MFHIQYEWLNWRDAKEKLDKCGWGKDSIERVLDVMRGMGPDYYLTPSP